MSANGAAAGGASALTVDAAVLNVFWELASVQAAKREAAAKQLVLELSRAQSEFDASKPSAASTAVAPLVSYSLRRLARGLGSGREGARQGFALAFTGAIAALPSLSVKAALDTLHTHSEPVTGSAKGAEAREIYLGKLFGYGAIARSLRKQSGSSGMDTSMLVQLTQEVSALSRKKGYLREAGAAVILELLDGATAAALDTVLSSAAAFAEWLCLPAATADAEALLLAVKLADRLSPSATARCSLLAASSSALFSKQHLEALLPALLSSTAAHPRVHSVWSAVVNERLSREKPGAAQVFWEVACESSLFCSSHERKFLGFKLFSMLLPTLHGHDVAALFSPNFMRCLVNSLTNEDTLLHASASLCLTNMLDYVRSEEGAGLQTSVIAALQRFAGGRFDRLTHTDAVSSLMQSLEPENADDYVDTLFGSFLAGTPVGQSDAHAASEPEDAASTERRITGRRVWAVEQLCGLSRSARTPAAVHSRIMRFLMLHAFFDVVADGDWSSSKFEEVKLGPAKPPLAAELRQLCLTRLMGLLADVLAAAQALVRQPGAQDAPAALAAAAEAAARKQRAIECVAGLDSLVELCSKLERARTAVVLVQPLSDEASAVRKAVRGMLPSLDGVAAESAGGPRSAASSQADAARVLLRVLLLLQLSAPEDYTADMEDLPRCLGAALAASGVAVPAGADDGEAPHHMDVLVEVLLSLLAKPSAIVRDIVERMFRAFASGVTGEGVRSMLRVVARTKGRRFSKAGEDSDSDGSDDEDEGSDEEEVEEEGDDGDDDAPEQAQPSGRAEKGAESESDEDSDDGAGMDDEAMFRTDAALAAVLSLSKDAKNKKKTAAEAMVHFKFRVLSLLELFIKAQPTSPALPAMVVPLLRALIDAAQDATSSGALAERITGMLVKSVCKAPSGKCDVPAEELEAWFSRCMRHASRGTVAKVTKPAVAACQYLLRMLAAAGPEGAAAAATLARAAAADYFASKKCRLPYSFLAHLVERLPKAAGLIIEDVAAHIAAAHEKDACSARDEFLVLEALKLTSEAMRHKQGSPEAATLAAVLKPDVVLRGVSSALSLRIAKPKRQVEVYKQAALCAEALGRFCAALAKPLPPAEASAVRAAAAKAKTSEPPLPPKVVAHLDRLAAMLASAVGGTKRGPGAQPTPQAKVAKQQR